MDSPCNFREIPEHGTALAQRYGYEYWYVERKVEDIEVLEARLRKRERCGVSERACIGLGWMLVMLERVKIIGRSLRVG